MPFVDDAGCRLWYRVTGRGEPLVLTGGFGLLHDQYEFVRRQLARQFTVLDWNYRGAGNSDRSWPGGTYHLDRWVDDLEAIVAHLGWRDVALWGTSTGSPISIRYAARYGKRVRALVTYPMFKADVGFRKAFEGFQYVAETFGYQALAALTSWIGCAAHNVLTGRGGRLALWEEASFRRNFAIENLNETLAIFANNDLTGDLRRIKVPTLLLLGDSGNLGAKTPAVRALVQEFRAHVRHAQVRTIPGGGGTYCMIEEPRATAAAVAGFLTQTKSTRARGRARGSRPAAASTGSIRKRGDMP
jgi:pimeloyl-ACP methyl ester carboxylesterase